VREKPKNTEKTPSIRKVCSPHSSKKERESAAPSAPVVSPHFLLDEKQKRNSIEEKIRAEEKNASVITIKLIVIVKRKIRCFAQQALRPILEAIATAAALAAA
jgi:hypothetical protein